MTIKIGINGFGRIGRLVFRIMQQRADDFEVLAINDLADAGSLAHMLKYDSVFGPFKGTVKAEGNAIIVNGKKVAILGERDPSGLPWAKMGVDVAVESTGVFRTREKIELHIKAGAKKVLLTVPAKDEIDATVVLGVNNETLKASDAIISNASCTTNCLAPMCKILNDEFGIEYGLMTTIHASTNDQKVCDMIHSDLRRARAAGVNIIPTTTGAAKAVGKVIPELDGKLNGMAMRVPTVDGSATDFVATTKKKITAEAFNAAVKAAAAGPLKGILEYCEDPIVSTDIIGNNYSCIFDSLCTMAIGDNMIKMLGWYDNEWGYSNRVCDLIKLAMEK